MRLAYSDNVVVSKAAPEGHETMVEAVTGEAKLYMPMEQLVDLAQERARVEKELAKAQKDLGMIQNKLANPKFVERAPENVVAGEREKEAKLTKLISQLSESLSRLGAR